MISGRISQSLLEARCSSCGVTVAWLQNLYSQNQRQNYDVLKNSKKVRNVSLYAFRQIKKTIRYNYLLKTDIVNSL